MKLEDSILDILGKAQKAQGITDRDLCKTAKIGVPELNSIRSGRREPAALERISRALGLRPEPIAEMANENWHAPTVALPVGVMMFTTPFAEMTVNHYLVWDPASQKAVAVDTGTDADALFAALERHKDDLHGVEAALTDGVDDCLEVQLSLGADRADRWALHLIPDGREQPQVPDWFGYRLI